MELPFPPMEPALAERAFDDPAWTAELKWDGVRNLALVEPGGVRLFTRRLRERTVRYPEMQALPDQFHRTRAVLDGELVVVAGGRPSFNRILERDLVTGEAEARRRAERIPATLMVFDLLELDGRDLLGEPLAARQERLRQLWRPGGPAHLVEGFPGAGAALFRAVAEAELEGVVLKRLDSPYRMGPEKSRHWLKVKRRLQMLCAVGGYTVTDGRPGALLVGAYDDGGRLRYLGRAGSGLTEVQLRTLRDRLPPAPCPFDPVPPVAAERFAQRPDQVVWVAAQLTVLVEFNEWTEGGRLRSPVIKGFTAEPPDRARLP